METFNHNGVVYVSVKQTEEEFKNSIDNCLGCAFNGEHVCTLNFVCTLKPNHIYKTINIVRINKIKTLYEDSI